MLSEAGGSMRSRIRRTATNHLVSSEHVKIFIAMGYEAFPTKRTCTFGAEEEDSSKFRPSFDMMRKQKTSVFEAVTPPIGGLKTISRIRSYSWSKMPRKSIAKRVCFTAPLAAAALSIVLFLLTAQTTAHPRPHERTSRNQGGGKSGLAGDENSEVKLIKLKNRNFKKTNSEGREDSHAPRDLDPDSADAAEPNQKHETETNGDRPAQGDSIIRNARDETESTSVTEEQTGTSDAATAAHTLLDKDGLAILNWSPRPGKELGEPSECRNWRILAAKPRLLRLYREHFTSHDFTDWFVYTAFFNELWHARQGKDRPVYLDVAANHARRWSGTWFFDRCMGWDGVCVEANEKYWEELESQRTCDVVTNCVSDRERLVNFSLTDAYGGVVSSKDVRGVNGSLHERADKFKDRFRGIKQMTCSTLRKEVKAQHVHFWSLDVEGHELEVLNGFDWEKTTVDVIVTENRSKQVSSILKDRGYMRTTGVLKDDIWIRDGSGFKISKRSLRLMDRFDNTTFTFNIA